MKGKVKIVKSIYQLANQETVYVINGVRYIVSSTFRSKKANKARSSQTLTDRIKKIITGDFVPLTKENPPSKMAEEYVCSTAGKED